MQIMMPPIISADRMFGSRHMLVQLTINGSDDILSLKYLKPVFYLGNISWTYHTSLKKVKEVNEKWICVGQVSFNEGTAQIDHPMPFVSCESIWNIYKQFVKLNTFVNQLFCRHHTTLVPFQGHNQLFLMRTLSMSVQSNWYRGNLLKQ